MGNAFSSDNNINSGQDPRLRLSGWRIGVIGFANYIYRKSFKFDDIINNTYPKKVLRDNRIKWYAYTTNDRKKLSEYGLIHDNTSLTGGASINDNNELQQLQYFNNNFIGGQDVLGAVDPNAPVGLDAQVVPNLPGLPSVPGASDTSQSMSPIVAIPQPKVEELSEEQKNIRAQSGFKMTSPNHITYITLIRENDQKTTNQRIDYEIPTAYAVEYIPKKILVNIYNTNTKENRLIIPVKWLIKYEPKLNSKFEEMYENGKITPNTNENDKVGYNIVDTYFKLALRIGKSLEDTRPDFTKFTLSQLLMYLGLCLTFGTNDLLDYFQVKYLTTVIRAYINENQRNLLLHRIAKILQQYKEGCKLTILAYTSFVHLAVDYKDNGGAIVELVNNNRLLQLTPTNCGAPDNANDPWYGPRLSSYPPPPVSRSKRIGNYLDLDILKERFPLDSLIIVWSSKSINGGGFKNRQILQLNKINRIEYKWVYDQNTGTQYPYVKRFVHDDEYCGSINAQIEYPLLSAVLLIPPDKNIYKNSKQSIVRKRKPQVSIPGEIVLGNSMLNSKKVRMNIRNGNRVFIPNSLEMITTNTNYFPPMVKPSIFDRNLKQLVYPEHKLDKYENNLIKSKKVAPGAFFWRFATIGEYIREKALYIFWFVDTRDKQDSQKKISIKTTEDLIKYITDKTNDGFKPINTQIEMQDTDMEDALAAMNNPMNGGVQTTINVNNININDNDELFFKNNKIYKY